MLVADGCAVAACVWMKDSYSIEAKQFSALGHQASSSQSEQQQALSRTDIDAIDHFLDESMRRFEATTCNTYRRCCFTVGSVASSGQSVQWMKNSSSSHGQNDHVTEKVSSCVQAHGGSSVGTRANAPVSVPYQLTAWDILARLPAMIRRTNTRDWCGFVHRTRDNGAFRPLECGLLPTALGIHIQTWPGSVH